MVKSDRTAAEVKPLSKLPKASRTLLEQALRAVEKGDIQELSDLVPALIACDLLDYPKAAPVDGTLLNVALGNRNAAMAFLLLEAGADVTVADGRRMTPLMKAASFSLDLTEELLRRGSDVLIRDTYGQTALHCAAGSILASVEILETLISAGSDPDGAENAGRTALHSAAAVLDPVKIEFLISRGATRSIAAHGNLGTPLQYLAETVRDLPSTKPGQREACAALLSQ